MRRHLRRIPVTLGLVGLLMAISAGSASAAVEAVTVEADDVGAHSAKLVGKVFLEGQEAYVGFEYGETKEYGLETETKAIPKHSGWYYVSARIKDLEPNTEYHFRFGAMVGTKGTLYHGSDVKFTTAHPIFEAEAYPAMLDTGMSTEKPLVIGLENGLSIKCDWSFFSGEMKKDAESFALVPDFKECTAVGFIGAKVSSNGCTFVFHAGSGTSGAMDLACPEGNSIVVKASTCTVTIPAQSDLGDVDGSINKYYTGVFKREIRYLIQSLDVSGLEYTKTDGFLCGFKGSGTMTDGTYTGDIPVFAEYEEGEEVGTPPISLDYVG